MKVTNGVASEVADHRSIAQLVRDLRDDAVRLLRQELRLFSVEIRQSARSIGKNGLLLVIGASVMFLALQALIVTACIGLSMLLAQIMPMTGAVVVGPLIVATLLAIGGWVTISRGIARLKSDTLWPYRSVEALKETQQWLKQETAITLTTRGRPCPCVASFSAPA